MSHLKISPNSFLEQQELNRLKKFIDTDGFRSALLQNSTKFGLVRKENEIFSNGLVQEDVGLTVKINAIKAINKDGNFITQPALTQLAVPADNNWYWLKIAYQTTNVETGTFSIDSQGNLVCTSTDAELLTILRGQPNHPSRITFTNAINNIIEYDVLEVIDDQNAVLQGSFTAESGLKLAVVGTFTPGYVPLTSEKSIFQYDSCLLTLVQSNTIDAPTHTSGYEFIIGRVNSDGVSIKIEDKRNEIFETDAKYFEKYITTIGNPLIGVSQITYDDYLSPKVQNWVQLEWAFKATSHSVNLKLNTITINNGSGGLFKSTNFSTAFTNGDFDGWRVYVSSGKYFKINTSSIAGYNIELSMENLSSEEFFSDIDSTVIIAQDLIITPDAEEIEIFASPDPSASNLINVKKFIFPINEGYGRINLNVYNATTTLYNLKYRYKHIKEYSSTFVLPDDAVGYYAETQFDTAGNLIVTPTQTPYVSDNTNGYIPLLLHPDAYSIFENRIDLGDVLGVNKSVLSNAVPLVQLTVGTSRQYQFYSDGDTSVSNDAVTLASNMFINLNKLNALGDTCRNGNFFLLHFKQKVVKNGFSLKIVTEYSNPSTFTELKNFTEEDFAFLAHSEQGIFIRATFDGTDWILTSTNETELNIIKKADAPYLATASWSTIPGMTYTTPDDGITRRWDIRFKSLSITVGDIVASAALRIFNVTDNEVYDISQAEYNGTSPIVASIQGSAVLDALEEIGPNKQIDIQVEKVGSTSSVNFYYNKFKMLERRR